VNVIAKKNLRVEDMDLHIDVSITYARGKWGREEWRGEEKGQKAK